MACSRRGCCLLCGSYTTFSVTVCQCLYIFLLKYQNFCNFFCAQFIFFSSNTKRFNLSMPYYPLPTIVGFVNIIFIPKVSLRKKNVYANIKVTLFQIKGNERSRLSQLRGFFLTCVREICLQHVLVQRGHLQVTHISNLPRRVTGLWVVYI